MVVVGHCCGCVCMVVWDRGIVRVGCMWVSVCESECVSMCVAVCGLGEG